MHVAGRISAEKVLFEVRAHAPFSEAKKVAYGTLRHQCRHFTIFANGQMQIEVCRDCVPDNLGFLRRVPFAYEKVVNLTTAADGKATGRKRNSPGIGKADVVENGGGEVQFFVVFEPAIRSENGAKVVCAVTVRQQVLRMRFTRKHFRVSCHPRVWRSKIGKIEIDGLQETEFFPNSIGRFSSSQESHVTQKVKPLRRCERAVVFLAPFQRAEFGAHHLSCSHFSEE